jgi:hypothetical protein
VAFLSWRGGVGWAVFCRTGIIRVGSGLGLRFPQSLCPQSRIFPHAPSANCNPRSCPHSFLSFSSRLAPRSRFVSKILHLSKFTVNCQAPYSFTPFSLAVYPPPLTVRYVPRRRHRFGPGWWAVKLNQPSKLSPVRYGQGRDCQAPELVLGHQRVAHLAVQDTQSDTRAHREEVVHPRKPVYHGTGM